MCTYRDRCRVDRHSWLRFEVRKLCTLSKAKTLAISQLVRSFQLVLGVRSFFAAQSVCNYVFSQPNQLLGPVQPGVSLVADSTARGEGPDRRGGPALACGVSCSAVAGNEQSTPTTTTSPSSCTRHIDGIQY